MAFENLLQHKTLILDLRQKRKTLSQICDQLENVFGLETTPGTLSRFLKQEAASEPKPRDLTLDESQRLDTIAMLTEVLVEVRTRSEEERRAIEHFAGQIAVMAATMTEFEAALSKVRPTSPHATDFPVATLRKIWLRAVIVIAPIGLLAGYLLGKFL